MKATKTLVIDGVVYKAGQELPEGTDVSRIPEAALESELSAVESYLRLHTRGTLAIDVMAACIKQCLEDVPPEDRIRLRRVLLAANNACQSSSNPAEKFKQLLKAYN